MSENNANNANNSNDDNTRPLVVLNNGTMVAHYRIEKKIGAGGMGEVYLAEDSKLKRRVALKFLPAHLTENQEIKIRFQREAQAVAALNHPNIVTIHEVGEFKGRPFFVMEHIEGKSLHHYAHKEPQTVDTIIEYAIQICQGLSEAHRSGIVHRDIKADNIAVDNTGRIRLLDFGLATVLGDHKLTKTGSTLGTVSYMSPEQVSGRDIDNRSDLFSFGIVLYELLTGRTPFKKENEGATLRAIVDEEPEPLARYKSNVPEKLQVIISKLLEKDKEFRYQNAEGVIADLKRLMYDSQQQPSSTLKVDTKKSKPIVPIIISAAVVIIVGFYFMFFRGTEEIVEAKIPVLIILPFENLGAAEKEYFSVGIREEIYHRLLSVIGMNVIAPRTADRFKNTDLSIEQIGIQTGADFILEATTRWDSSGEVDRIRIIPRLTKTSDNYLMWSDSYDQKLIDIFAVQSKIADQIAIALGLTLVNTDQDAPEGSPTTNMEAYAYYLRGIDISGQNFYMQDLNEAINMYDSAIALDPDFALAYAQKSILHSTFNFFFTTVRSIHHREEALKAAEKALALSPNLPTAHIAMGYYHNYIKLDYEKALASFALASSETSDNADLSQAIGIVKMRQGEWQESISNFEEAIRLDPLSDQRYFYMANAQSMIGEYESGHQYINRALVLDPTNTDAAFFKIFMNLLQHGKLSYGEKTFESIAQKAGLAEIATYELASSSALGLWRFIVDQIETEQAIEDVRRIANVRGAITELSPHITHLSIGQIYDLTGHHDSALIHYDSSRIILTEIMDKGYPEYHAYSELGLTYALLGKMDLAIENVKKAKEELTVDDCHW